VLARYRFGQGETRIGGYVGDQGDERGVVTGIDLEQLSLRVS
jgi:hypothetical protein